MVTPLYLQYIKYDFGLLNVLPASGEEMLFDIIPQILCNFHMRYGEPKLRFNGVSALGN